VYRLGYVQALKMLKIAAKPMFLGYYAAKMDDQFIRSIIHRLAVPFPSENIKLNSDIKFSTLKY
jgi:hypothetical protein